MTAEDVVITIRELGISGSIRALEQVTASVEGEDEELTGDID